MEVNMSPSNLRKMASTITGAQAGMEFEMIVPGAAGDDDENLDPDFDYDESISDFDDIVNFFSNGDMANSRRQVRDVIEGYQSKYQDYIMELQGEAWHEVAAEEVSNYIEKNADRDEMLREALDGLGLSEEEIDAALEAGTYANIGSAEERNRVKETPAYHHWSEADDAVDEMISEKVQEALNEQNDDYTSAEEYWRDSWDYPTEAEFLSDEGIDTMKDFYDDCGDLSWPHVMSSNNGGQAVGDVAEEFGNAIGRPWNASSDYHGARREAGKYVVEPDGSLDPDDPGSEAGLEFVSPPLPVTELLSDLRKVVKWAKDRGCYTNESTGLHMNVSVPGFSLEKLDFVKLALFIGDQYILESFGRTGNTYCKSALELVKRAATPDKVEQVMSRMKEQLGTVASKIIHSGITSKYTSINTKDGYIEFRSPGGDWLNANIDVLETTLLRFVVAMNIALDESAYKEEYAKKLYKLIAPSDDKTNTMQYFAKFAAGELPRSALASFVRQAQLQRKVAKGKVEGKMWWRVGLVSNPNYSIEVVGKDKKEAIQAAMDNNSDLMRFNPDQDFTATPLRPYTEQVPAGGTEGNWGIWITSNERFARLPGEYPAGQEIPVRRFRSQIAAAAFLDQTRNNNPNMRSDIEVREIPADYQAPAPSGQQFRSTETVPREGNPRNLVPTGPGPWEIYRISNGESIRELGHTHRGAAEEEARSALGLRGEAPELYGVRTRQGAPGSAPQQQTFSGQWEVRLGGQPVFRVNGENQGVANAAAREWLSQRSPEFNQDHQGQEAEVVPIYL
jgi:hypothetical protein